MATQSVLLGLVVAITICTSSLVMAGVKLTHLSSVYLPYNITSAGPQYNLSSDAVEQLSYDPKDKLIYAAGEGVLHVVDCSDPNKLTRLYSKFVDNVDFTDVEVCGDFVLVSVDNLEKELEGQLHVYKKFKRGPSATLELVVSVLVGPKPDMISPRLDCLSVVIALEAEAFFAADGTFVDPEGAVVIVHFAGGIGVGVPVVKTLDFNNYNNKVEELLKTGVRYVYTENNTFSADVEPEFVAIDHDSNKAYVCLQENNGVAEVDLATERITGVHGLGHKTWGVLDASDRDKGIQLGFWPVRAWYQPDTIQFATWKGRKLVFSANEGDQKKYSHFREYLRGKQFKALGNDIPEVVKSWLRDDTQLGRLKLSRLDGQDSNGVYQALYTFGARSFSIWDPVDNFRLLYDSGSDIETITAMKCPHAFNTEGDNVDEKSDSKGPETESLAVGEIGGRLYIFIGNENPGTIFAYSIGDDVTKPRFESIFCDGLTKTNKSLQDKFDAREIYGLDPEDIKFVSASDSPAGVPVLMVAGALTGTISLLKVEVTADVQVKQ